MLSFLGLFCLLVLCPYVTSNSLPVLACITVGYSQQPKCVRGLYKPSNLTEGICARMIAAMNEGTVFTCTSHLRDYCQFPTASSAQSASLLITGSSDELNLVLDTNCDYFLNTLTTGTYPCFKQLGGRSVIIPSSIFGQIYQAVTTQTFGLLSGLIPGLCSQMMKIP